MELMTAIVDGFSNLVIMIMAGIVTGTVAAIPSHLRHAQDQRDHQMLLMGQILLELEKLNRKDRV